MSAHKYTPGPWGADSSHYGTIYVEANAVIDKRLVQEICAVGPTESGRDQQEANARLIAAAPELLEAAMAFIAPFDGIEVVQNSNIAKARAAIAKATGGAA